MDMIGQTICLVAPPQPGQDRQPSGLGTRYGGLAQILKIGYNNTMIENWLKKKRLYDILEIQMLKSMITSLFTQGNRMDVPPLEDKVSDQEDCHDDL